jgi:chemotaxis protein MotB
MARKEEHEAPENAERWLLSYADFITLLMVFFVVMYSMSRVDQDKFAVLAESLSGAMGGGSVAMGDGTVVVPVKDLTPEQIDQILEENPETAEDLEAAILEAALEKEKSQLSAMQIQLQEYLAERNLQNDVTIEIDDRGLVVSLNASILFDSGSAVIHPAVKDTLKQVGEIMNRMPNYIRVEGHTDNVPINTAQFRNNWALSVIRATNVVDIFIDQSGIEPRKLVASGYGEFKPKGDNNTAEGRSLNRRVDIILLSSKYNALEEGAEAETSDAEAAAETETSEEAAE